LSRGIRFYMAMLTTKQALERLSRRGIEVSYSNLALWVRTGKFEGAVLDESSPRGAVWLIPEKSVDEFEPPPKGRPPKAKAKTTSKASKKSRKK
jgi:hypothetical protein